MKLRLDIAAQIAARIGDNIDPRELLEVVAGEAASPRRGGPSSARNRASRRWRCC